MVALTFKAFQDGQVGCAPVAVAVALLSKADCRKSLFRAIGLYATQGWGLCATMKLRTHLHSTRTSHAGAFHTMWAGGLHSNACSQTAAGRDALASLQSSRCVQFAALTCRPTACWHTHIDTGSCHHLELAKMVRAASHAMCWTHISEWLCGQRHRCHNMQAAHSLPVH